MENNGLNELLVYIYVTGIIIAKDLITALKDFILIISKSYLDKHISSFTNKTTDLLKANRALNDGLVDMAKEIGSDLAFIVIFHNGVAKNFMNYSIRFEHSTGSNIINTYQVKPLSPYYPYLETLLKKNSFIFNTKQTPLFISGTEDKLVYVAPLYQVKKTVLSEEGKNLCGCLVIVLPEHKKVNKLYLDTKLIEIQRILMDNPDLVF